MKQLDKEALLAKAKRDYPIGTKIKSITGKIFISSGKIEIERGKNIYVEDKDRYVHLVYFSDISDKWAEIISTPKEHDGYILPFDIFDGNLKKGEVIRNKKDGFSNKNTWEDIDVLNSYIVLPSEWVETWEKHYPETTEVKPDYSKVIELIEERLRNIKSNVESGHYSLLASTKHRIKELEVILTKIKAL